jgi:hypothetical protein
MEHGYLEVILQCMLLYVDEQEANVALQIVSHMSWEVAQGDEEQILTAKTSSTFSRISCREHEKT